MQPHRDTRVITGRVPLLDPSAYSLISKPEERSYPPPIRLFRNFDRRDAQRTVPAGGIAEARIYGTGAENLETEELPPLTLKNPWYGYALGLWNAEDDAMAEAIARGEPVRMRERPSLR